MENKKPKSNSNNGELKNFTVEDDYRRRTNITPSRTKGFIPTVFLKSVQPMRASK